VIKLLDCKICKVNIEPGSCKACMASVLCQWNKTNNFSLKQLCYKLRLGKISCICCKKFRSYWCKTIQKNSKKTVYL